MILKETLRNHLKVLWIARFITLLYLLIWWYFGFKNDFFFVLLGFYILTVVPSFYLHINYHIKNRGMLCEIFSDRIRLVKNGMETIISNNEIKEIVVYKSASMDRGGIPITPMESYFFVRIFDNKDKTYELTCLMDTTIDKSIEIVQGVRIFREKSFFNIA